MVEHRFRLRNVMPLKNLQKFAANLFSPHDALASSWLELKHEFGLASAQNLLPNQLLVSNVGMKKRLISGIGGDGFVEKMTIRVNKWCGASKMMIIYKFILILFMTL